MSVNVDRILTFFSVWRQLKSTETLSTQLAERVAQISKKQIFNQMEWWFDILLRHNSEDEMYIESKGTAALLL